MSRFVKKKIAAFVMSVLVCCGCCIMTIEGEIKDGNLVSDSKHNKESNGSSDNGNHIEGASVSVLISDNIRSYVQDSVNRTECNYSDSIDSGIDIYVDGHGERNKISCENSEVISGNTSNNESNESGSSTGITENTDWKEQTGIEQLIFEACARHGIDSSVVLGIARLETGNFTSYASECVACLADAAR